MPFTLRAAIRRPIRLSCRIVIQGILPLTRRAAFGCPISQSCEIVIQGIHALHPAGDYSPSNPTILSDCDSRHPASHPSGELKLVQFISPDELLYKALPLREISGGAFLSRSSLSTTSFMGLPIIMLLRSNSQITGQLFVDDD